MRAAEAVALLRKTIFKPGWKIRAEHYWADQVMVSFLIDTADSSYPDTWTGEYNESIRLCPDKIIDVSELDEMSLLYQVLKFSAETGLHEDREFLRIRQPDGTWKAPLHPHTSEGNAAWAGARQADTAQIAAELLKDMTS